MTLSERLKLLKKSNNLLQKDIADNIGISLRTYQRYEYGEREPSASILIALANYFAVPIDYLIDCSEIHNFNITTPTNTILSDKQEKLLQIFDTLDDFNKGALLERATILLEKQR